jgi:hypothetical protein
MPSERVKNRTMTYFDSPLNSGGSCEFCTWGRPTHGSVCDLDGFCKAVQPHGSCKEFVRFDAPKDSKPYVDQKNADSEENTIDN